MDRDRPPRPSPLRLFASSPVRLFVCLLVCPFLVSLLCSDLSCRRRCFFLVSVRDRLFLPVCPRRFLRQGPSADCVADWLAKWLDCIQARRGRAGLADHRVVHQRYKEGWETPLSRLEEIRQNKLDCLLRVEVAMTMSTKSRSRARCQGGLRCSAA